MPKRDAVRQLAVLKAAYPREQIAEETVAVYVTKLLDIDAELLAAAINRLVEKSRFFPTIAEIRETAARLAGLLPPSPAEALALVRRADRSEAVFRRDGSYAYTEKFWDWPADADERTVEFCSQALQKAGEPTDPEGKPKFGWEGGFTKSFETVVEDTVRFALANLSGAKLLQRPATPPGITSPPTVA